MPEKKSDPKIGSCEPALKLKAVASPAILTRRANSTSSKLFCDKNLMLAKCCKKVMISWFNYLTRPRGRVKSRNARLSRSQVC